MIELDDVQARVLGSLIEKSLTTPDLYPLTMNGLVNACNQKSSRDPVMTLDEPTVGQGLHALIEKSLAGRLHEPGGRVPKFMHHAEMLTANADAKVVGTLCVLLLRGPQTPGEIKTRTERLCRFESVAEVEALLQDLSSRPEPCIAKLSRQPGQKESRYRHLFSAGAPTEAPATTTTSDAPVVVAPSEDRVARLEKRVEALEALVRSWGNPPSSTPPRAE